MGENSAIEWCDHTFNPWVGCTKISAVCDNCYAEAWAKRTGNATLWQGERRFTSDANWRQPIIWNRKAEAAGVRARVFCASLADVFDNQAPDIWRSLLWELIRATPALDWLLLTKRPQNIASRLPHDWGNGWPNDWLGTTVENQAEADRRIPQLLAVPAARHFLSCEPLLGPVRLRSHWIRYAHPMRPSHPEAHLDRRIDWVITGGESGPKARPMHPDWARGLRDQCADASVPFFFKRWGEWTSGENAGGPMTRSEDAAWWWNGEWEIRRMTPRESEEMHTDDEPDVYRVGKKRAGALLDGLEHREVPHA